MTDHVHAFAERAETPGSRPTCQRCGHVAAAPQTCVDCAFTACRRCPEVCSCDESVALRAELAAARAAVSRVKRKAWEAGRDAAAERLRIDARSHEQTAQDLRYSNITQIDYLEISRRMQGDATRIAALRPPEAAPQPLTGEEMAWAKGEVARLIPEAAPADPTPTPAVVQMARAAVERLNALGLYPAASAVQQLIDERGENARLRALLSRALADVNGYGTLAAEIKEALR